MEEQINRGAMTKSKTLEYKDLKPKNFYWILQIFIKIKKIKNLFKLFYLLTIIFIIIIINIIIKIYGKN